MTRYPKVIFQADDARMYTYQTDEDFHISDYAVVLTPDMKLKVVQIISEATEKPEYYCKSLVQIIPFNDVEDTKEIIKSAIQCSKGSTKRL